MVALEVNLTNQSAAREGGRLMSALFGVIFCYTTFEIISDSVS